MSKFLPTLNNEEQSRTLYHCIRVSAEGDAIRPSIHYGAEIPEGVRQKLAMPADEHTPLVFASAHLSKALAFGLMPGEKLFNTLVEGQDSEIVVICDRDKTMSRERNATVYAFADNGFTDLPNMQRQCVSTNAVPFSATTEALKIKNTDDLMRAGLQIFSFKEGIRDLYDSKETNDLRYGGDEKIPAKLAELMKSGRIIWENQARGINPNPALAEQMGMDINAQKKRPQPAATRPKTGM